MSSRIGRMLSVQIFGESHGPAVGVTLDGLPAGLALDQDALNAFLQRRAARGSAIATARRESDLPRIVSGLKDGITTGQPLTALFDNADTHSADYGFLPDRPRPGHADYPAWVRSAGFDDLRGSGHHSGRLTLPYAFAGGVALQLLSREGVRVGAHVLSIASERDDALDPLCPDMDALSRCHAQPVPTLDPEAGSRMYAAIMEARAAGDSLGGVVECAAVGLPAGLGAPFFEGVEAVMAAQLFSIPAVKGVEFGAGFAAARLRGSENNDPFCVENGKIVTKTNHCGGILGGISNGMPVVFRAAFKPTPSISREQDSVSLSRMEETKLVIHGRHDPCIVPRAVPCVEAAAAIAVLDAVMERKKELGYGY